MSLHKLKYFVAQTVLPEYSSSASSSHSILLPKLEVFYISTLHSSISALALPKLEVLNLHIPVTNRNDINAVLNSIFDDQEGMWMPKHLTLNAPIHDKHIRAAMKSQPNLLELAPNISRNVRYVSLPTVNPSNMANDSSMLIDINTTLFDNTPAHVPIQAFPYPVHSAHSTQDTTNHWNHTSYFPSNYPQDYSSVPCYPQSLSETYPATTISSLKTIDPTLLTIDSTHHSNYLENAMPAPIMTLAPFDIVGLPPFQSFDLPFDAPAYAEIMHFEALPDIARARQADSTPTTSQSGPNQEPKRFRCSGCSRVYDRTSRAKNCENTHRGIISHRCSGTCGNVDW